jgi:hypothetical protein
MERESTTLSSNDPQLGQRMGFLTAAHAEIAENFKQGNTKSQGAG